ncbi:MAG: hypothetical protein ACOC4M_09105 [Promethearchaeia archaeon]
MFIILWPKFRCSAYKIFIDLYNSFETLVLDSFGDGIPLDGRYVLTVQECHRPVFFSRRCYQIFN